MTDTETVTVTLDLREQQAIKAADAIPSTDELRRLFYKDLPFLERFLAYKKASEERPADPRDFLKPNELPRLETVWMLTHNAKFFDEDAPQLPDARWETKQRDDNSPKHPINVRLDNIQTRFTDAARDGDKATVDRLLEEARYADRGEKSIFSGRPHLRHPKEPYPSFEAALLNNTRSFMSAYSAGHKELGDYLIAQYLTLHNSNDDPNALRKIFFWGEHEEYSPFGAYANSAESIKANLELMKQIFTARDGTFDESAYYERLEKIVTDSVAPKEKRSYSTPYSAIRSAASIEATPSANQQKNAIFEVWLAVLADIDAKRGLTGKDSHSYKAFRDADKDYSAILGTAIVNGRTNVSDAIVRIIQPILSEDEFNAYVKKSIFNSSLDIDALVVADSAETESITAPLKKYLSDDELAAFIRQSIFSEKSHIHENDRHIAFLSHPELFHSSVNPNGLNKKAFDFILKYGSAEEILNGLTGGGRVKSWNDELRYDSGSLSYLAHKSPEFIDAQLNMIMAFAREHQKDLPLTPDEYQQRFIANLLDHTYQGYYKGDSPAIFTWCLDKLDSLPKDQADEILGNVVRENGLFVFYYIHGCGQFDLSQKLRTRIEAIADFPKLEEYFLAKEINSLRPYDERKAEPEGTPPRISGRTLREEYGLTLWHLMFDEFTEHWDAGESPDYGKNEAGFLKCLNLMKQYKLTEEQESKLLEALGLPAADHSFDWKLVSQNTYKKVMYSVSPQLRWTIERYALSNNEIDARYQTDRIWPDAPHEDLVKCHPLSQEQQATYDRLLPVMEHILEHESNGVAQVHAYKLACLFDNFSQASKYIAHHAQADSRHPIHDLMLYELPKQLPANETWQRDIWAQRMVKFGFGVASLLQRAVEIEQVMRNEIKEQQSDLSDKQITNKLRDKLKNITPKELKEYARQVVYDSVEGFVPDPDVTDYLIRVGVDQVGYERTAEIIAATINELAQHPKSDKTPDIVIDGADLKDNNGTTCAGFTLEKVKTVGEKDSATLQKNIARCLWVGFEVNCCNHLDGETRGLAMAQATSPTTSLYVIKKQSRKQDDDKVVAKLSGWLCKTGDVFVFNSWERLGNDHDRLCEPFLREAAMQIMRDNPRIREVRIGRPRSEGVFDLAEKPVSPANPLAVAADSSGSQYIVMNRITYEIAKGQRKAAGFGATHTKRDPLSEPTDREVG